MRNHVNIKALDGKEAAEDIRMTTILMKQQGSALLIVMALMVILSMMAILSADRATEDITLSYNQANSEQAFYMADAGIKHAFAMINDSAEWRTGFINQSLGAGGYTVAVIDSVTNPALGDTVQFRSTATVFEAVANVEAYLIPLVIRPFEYAAFGGDSVVMKNTACLDSYDSDLGTYLMTQMNDSSNMGSNGTIGLANQADVYGNLSTSLDGGITLDGSAIVTGDTTSTAPAQDLMIVSDQEYIDADLYNDAPAGLSGTYSYDTANDTLRLNNDDSLTLASGTYYFSSIFLGQKASIQLAPGAKVTIYLSGDITLQNPTSINLGGNPSDFIIYSQGGTLTLGNGAEFFAAFYGPNTDIDVNNNTDVYGSLVGKSVKIANSACIHYDRSLRKIIKIGTDGYSIIGWREL